MFNRIFGRGNRQGRGGGRGQGGGTKPGAGPTGACVCPKCGYQMMHAVGQRCMDIACPKCGTKMVRQ